MFPVRLADGRPKLDEKKNIVYSPDNGKAFDFEFYYRDGDLVLKRPNYDGETLGVKEYQGEIPLGMPGRRCKTSINKVIF